MSSKFEFFLLLAVVCGVQSDRHIVPVSTNIGVINGFTENVTFLGKTSKVNLFLGIPFAEPPVGDYRFKKPVPKSPLNAPFDAFTHNNACIQGFQTPNTTYSEDCLYLNIYVPEREDLITTLPVMIWIYGGGFQFGESNLYLGERLAMSGDVIVVTLNYRVSIFGFLSTGDDASPGNYGLWDQRIAIEWVHDNIAAFGGDHEKVTLFGESAGSASVVYQGLRPGKVNNLFQRVIAQSGSVTAWWANTNKGPQVAKTVGSIADCSTISSDSIITCLRKVPAQQLINLVSSPPKGVQLSPYAFVPTFDDDFITFDPKHVFDLQSRQSKDAVQFFASLDFLTGVNAGEGVGGLDQMFGVTEIENFLPNRTDFENRLVPLLVKAGYGETAPTALSKVIIAEYTNWNDPDNSSNIREEYLRMHADFTYNANLYKTLDTQSTTVSTKKTYMYYLDYEPDTSFFGSISWYKKAIHGDDLPLVFGFGLSTGLDFSPEEWELKMAESVMTLWTNFAKTGDPNSPVDLGLNWQPYTADDQHYLQITRNMTSSNVKQRWNIGAPYFWLEAVPSIIQSKTCDIRDHGTTSSSGPGLISGKHLYTAVYIFLSIIIVAVNGIDK